MAKEVKIPQISEGVDSARVSEILIETGDYIETDQSVIVLETDKASAEVPSSHEGTVKEIKVAEGDEVEVGAVVLILEEDGKESGGEEEEKEEEDAKGKKEKENKKKKDKEEEGDKREEEEVEEGRNKTPEDKEGKEKKDKEEEPEDKEKEEEKEESEEKKKEGTDDERKTGEELPASPMVRKLARELGVDLASVEGSGPGGRISEEDVKSYTRKQGTDKAAEPKGLSLPDFSKWGAVETKSLSGIRMATGKNTTASWQHIPHVFQFDEADITGIEQYMEKNREKVQKEGGKLTITAILVKIVANALQQFPKFNASVDMERKEMILKKYINISIAVATDKGLLMPVIKDADRKNIIELAVEITEVAEKARNGKLGPEEMEGGNFSVSNLGGVGGTNFTPVIYHPQVAILGISQAAIRPIYVGGNFEPREILPLSLSYDHRLIDGVEGAGFLSWIKQALEDPYKALLGA
ncbi:2-oxo acid dehydrogenase subunit E2 [Sinomicrobium pectinilyticum]|uniref:Dihydrolipoamide acetyltransferase component of pyruvate dehydrogenase complex n=1 Tax=Sinomicrobium pectinilyticum TaxID=1084421 RepID=A0A3N0F391_SINP1|nr:dihydrolipoamide acetyltransferase family protein [Sinomicrobium pectinilyticum]RNL94515.1 2-oxo acid dehydrogenase subunit E2 [Sinomicrobium pectinilyticum]